MEENWYYIRFRQPLSIRWWEYFALLFIKKQSVVDDLTGMTTTYKKWRSNFYLIETKGPYYPGGLPKNVWKEEDKPTFKGLGRFL